MIKTLTIAATAILMASAPAYATCKTNTYDGGVKVTSLPDGGAPALNGTAITKALYCPPITVANGTCTGETLAEQAPSSPAVDVKELADILKHQDLNVIASIIASLQAGHPVQIWKPEQPGAC